VTRLPMALPVLYSPSPTNTTTGNMVTAWVGSTRAETDASCAGCPVRDECYARSGNVVRGLGCIQKAARLRPEEYTAAGALDRAPRSAMFSRWTGMGDLARADRHQAETDLHFCAAAGLPSLGYTQFPWEAPWLRPWLRASCVTWESALRWLGNGWKVAIIGPRDWRLPVSVDGFTGPVCPVKLGERIDCNRCGRCQIATGPDIIIFPLHGTAARSKILPTAATLSLQETTR